MRAIIHTDAILIAILIFFCSSCLEPAEQLKERATAKATVKIDYQAKLDRLYYFSLKSSQDQLPPSYQEIYGHLEKAADKMDDIFWLQSYGNKDSLLGTLKDSSLKKLVEINYGPYDRMEGNQPLIAALAAKSPGANFYPLKMTKAEIARLDEGLSKESLIRRGENGNLFSLSYTEAYANDLALAAEQLRKAAKLSSGVFSDFLDKRAEGLVSGRYEASDDLWLDLWDEPLDILIGPIESYEDELKGIKSAYQACIVWKDQEASAEIMPLLRKLRQLELELKPGIRYERGLFPELESVGVYDALYFSGLFNAGSKSMGLNAPNFMLPYELDKRRKRRLILKNILAAKYKHIALPIAERLLDEKQAALLSERAFVQYVLFHELSHGWELLDSELKNPGKSIQVQLQEYASVMEEGKGDVLGLFLLQEACKQGLLPAEDLKGHYITFLLNNLRALRFGRSSAHAIANMAQLNFLIEKGAYVFDEERHRYLIRTDKMEESVRLLLEEILSIQAAGDKNRALRWISKYGQLSYRQEQGLAILSDIPLDLRFQ